MPLRSTDVEKIAHLARLAISAEEAQAYTRDLSRILDLVDQMNAVDTTGTPPMAHPLDVHQRLREDRVTEADQRERLQTGAPVVERGLYLVPKVIE